MNDQQLETKIHQDAGKVKKDLNTLIGDSAVQLGRFEANVSQATVKAKDNLTAWVGDNVSRLSEGIEKGTSDAREIAIETAASVKKDVGHGLSQYNAKAQEVANRVPGDFGQKAARYPWVAMSIALVVGFVMGLILKPTRLPVAPL